MLIHTISNMIDIKANDANSTCNSYPYTLNMTFNQLFVSDFIKTHSFQRFINLRISQDIQEQNADLITFDHCIAKTMQSISSVTNINELNLKRLRDKVPDGTLSSNGYATSSSWLQ